MLGHLIIGTALLAGLLPVAAGSADALQPLVAVRAYCPGGSANAGAAIPVTVEIVNNLDRPIHHAAYSLTPTDLNDETLGITIQAVYRDRMDQGSIPVVSRPSLELRHATPVHRIDPGEMLQVHIDASKWEIEDGWKPGRYTVSIRVTELRVGTHATISVTSELLEFEIGE